MPSRAPNRFNRQTFLSSRPRPLDRRSFLQVGTGWITASSLGLTAPPQRRRNPPLPRVNGAINLQPLRRFDEVTDFTPPVIVPDLVDLQMRAIYELGFEQIRMTISFNNFGPDFLAAIPYVRAARALGIDVLGIIGQFGFGYDLARALSDPDRRAVVLGTYASIFGPKLRRVRKVKRSGQFDVQIFNEPTNFLGLDPADYVRYFLAPAREHLLRIAPNIGVVAAAPVGRLDGVFRARGMLEAGIEDHCDRVAFHIYDRRIIEYLSGLSRRPVWITETGVRGTDNHLGWVTEVLPDLEQRMPEVERVFYYELFDFEPGAFRLIELIENADGFASRIESTALCKHFIAQVEEATGGKPHAGYRELVPDITHYFPTEQDLRLINSARLAL